MKDYRIEPYDARHRPAVRMLLRQLLTGRSEETLDRYLTWKYEKNPWIHQPLTALMFTGTELVGMRALIGTRWSGADGVFMTLPAAEDLVVDSRHRDRGLFLNIDRALGRMARDQGFTSIISSSARNETTQALQLATGWELVATVQASMHPPTRTPGPVGSSDLVRRIIGRTARRQRRPFLVASLVEARRWPTEIRLVDEPDPDSMAALPRPRGASAFEPVHDSEFYRWRLANPDRHYEFLEWRDTQLRGFLVLTRLAPPSRQVRIVDSAAESGELLEAMIGAVTAAPRLSLAMAAHRLPSEPEKLGFGRRPQDFVKVFVKQLTHQPPPELGTIDLLDSMLV